MTLMRLLLVMLFVSASTTISLAQPEDTLELEKSYPESLSPQRNLLLVVNDTSFDVAGAPSAASLTLDVLTMYHLTIENTSRVTYQLRFGRHVTSGAYDDSFTDNLFEDTVLSIYDLEQPRAPIIVTSDLVEFALPSGKSFQLQFRLSREKLGTWELRDFGNNNRAGMAIDLNVN